MGGEEGLQPTLIYSPGGTRQTSRILRWLRLKRAGFHSFNQQIFIESLLCAGLCARPREPSRDKIGPLPTSGTFQSNKQINQESFGWGRVL